jgi:hypothetical protein
MSKYKIAIIVTWFGTLPPYFDAWYISAKYNKTIDFLFFTDCKVPECENIHVFNMSLDETISLFERKLNRKISITNSYKFCDCRPFFGQTYEDYLDGYDFWGYCDIDLVFGDIRQFITDEKLDQYDRFYQYGHLSLFRNNSIMNHLYDLPGGIYSYKEIFQGKAKTTPEEHYGINRICDMNNIPWYTNIDFADFNIWYTPRLEADHGINNYPDQIFIWHSGKAYMLYRENNAIHKKEFVYMHWQKRKPNIVSKEDMNEDSYLVIYPDKIVVCNDKCEAEKMFELNKDLSSGDRKKFKHQYFIKKIGEFNKAKIETKRIWIRQKTYSLITKRSYL